MINYRFIHPFLLYYSYYITKRINYVLTTNFAQVVYSIPKKHGYKLKKIQEYVIPEENISDLPLNQKYEVIYQSFNLPKPDTVYIKFYMNDISKKTLHGFLPATKGNIYYQGGFTKTLEDDLNWQYWNYGCSYLHITNVYCSFTATFVTKDLKRVCLDQTRINKIRDSKAGMCFASVDSAIGVGHTQVYQLGHFISDVLAPLLMFPENILKTSAIIINKHAKRFVDSVRALGISLDNVFLLGQYEWVFCEHYYTPYKPLPHLAHWGSLMANVSTKLRAYYHVENIKPSRFIYVNRAKGYSRRLTNMNEIVKIAAETYPKYNMEYIEDTNSLNESAHLWASAKFVFVVAGSNSAKNVFMNEHTIMVAILSNLLDNSPALRGGPNHIFTLYFRSKNVKHEAKNCKADITRSIRVIGIALYVVEHGHFDPNEKFRD